VSSLSRFEIGRDVLFQIVERILIADIKIGELCQVGNVEETVRMLPELTKVFLAKIEREDVVQVRMVGQCVIHGGQDRAVWMLPIAWALICVKCKNRSRKATSCAVPRGSQPLTIDEESSKLEALTVPSFMELADMVPEMGRVAQKVLVMKAEVPEVAL